MKRDDVIADFLSNSPYATWSSEPIAGDASSRRYFRLQHGKQSVILMDAGPEGSDSTRQFCTIGTWLRDQGLCAPQVLKDSTSDGLLLMDDLGDLDVASFIRQKPQHVQSVYTAAVDVLVRLEASDPLSGLPILTPQVGSQMLDVTVEWYADSRDGDPLFAAMRDCLERHCDQPNIVALRDYHAENLIWRADKSGLSRLGLLDFQDAILAPKGYDLVSLLRDVRRSVDPQVSETALRHFISSTGPLSRAAFACLAVQRNLRILGVFARLAQRDKKPRYLAMVPTVWTMVLQDLAHPALSDLRGIVQAILPPPDRSRIKELL